jgi:Cu(I)/Ag(I) efflux system membrane protein CusA/SilA
MKRIAAPMIGGVVSALLTALIIFPAIYSIWRGYKLGSNRDFQAADN